MECIACQKILYGNIRGANHDAPVVAPIVTGHGEVLHVLHSELAHSQAAPPLLNHSGHAQANARPVCHGDEPTASDADGVGDD